MFKDIVTSREELRARFGAPSERAVQKDRGRLDAHTRAFIARSPFVLIATAGTAGRCDVSPKGDAPGFVTSWTMATWWCRTGRATTASTASPTSWRTRTWG